MAFIKMVENQRECTDIINQLTAAKNALDKISTIIVENNFKDCILRELENGKDIESSIDKAIKLILKLKS